ncbi:MAG: Hpt domain-containing protein [Chloroflexota bacterium]
MRFIPAKHKKVASMNCDEPSDPIDVEDPPIKPPIDQVVLGQLKEELAEIAPDLLAEFVIAYLDNAPQMLESIKVAIAESNGEVLNRMAHTLKSNSARLGAMRCSSLCQELEIMGEQGQFVAASDKVTALDHEYKQAEAQLRREIDTPSEKM